METIEDNSFSSNQGFIGILSTILANLIDFDKSLLKKELKELIKAGLSLSAASSYLAKKKNLTKNMVCNLI